ncbi:hypothetical protein VP1G_03545 [Cytospora mali]|uniref:Rhodopsin domain-containing protein n=1 Tax=Cytospora mali TaxID=578113 RepID=A0A194UWR1_CYTMA|nr:hypothetical protein VP1G_03545 [Valsa mali var. pyri (nom. inval.)]
MDAFLMRPGYAELAKTVNSICASITTIFLFTRLWARRTHYKGLWWDDFLLIATWAFQLAGNGLAAAAPRYGFNILTGSKHGWVFVFSAVSCFYIAMGLGKAAFATTLLRLSTGGTKILLCFVVAIVCAFQTAVTIVTWLNICGTASDMASISERCVPMNTLLWIHIGNAIVTVCADATLAYLPWRIITKVYLPKREKWTVALTMSLVGLAGPVCLARVAIAGMTQELEKKHGQVDWSYGAVTIWGLLQAEVAIYVVAQTIPLLRVLLLSDSSKDSKSPGYATRLSATNRKAKGKTPAAGVEPVQEVRTSIELVHLPSGKIVTADSEEGKAFKSSEAGEKAGQELPTTEKAASEPQLVQGVSGATLDDETHRIWADMGLSRRAWSKSPSPPPDDLPQQSLNASTGRA